MAALSWPSIIFYSLFSCFVFYQQLHGRRFSGANSVIGLLINISAFIGMVTGFIYLIYYGWSVVWWAPIVIFFIGLILSIFNFFLERLLGAYVLSIGGFIGWPVCAYLMFSYIPAGKYWWTYKEEAEIDKTLCNTSSCSDYIPYAFNIWIYFPSIRIFVYGVFDP